MANAVAGIARLASATYGVRFRFLATFGDQVPAVWPQSPCRLTSWFRFAVASPKVAKSPGLMRRTCRSRFFIPWPKPDSSNSNGARRNWVEGAKPFMVKPTPKLVADLVIPLIGQLEQQVQADLR